MTKKTYKLEDFFTKTNGEESTRMPLLMDGMETEHYLMVKGIGAKSVQRERILTQIAKANADEKAATLDDEVIKHEFIRDTKEVIESEFALALIDGWSFGEFSKEKLKQLLLENEGLSFSVIVHSASSSNYLAKK